MEENVNIPISGFLAECFRKTPLQCEEGYSKNYPNFVMYFKLSITPMMGLFSHICALFGLLSFKL